MNHLCLSVGMLETNCYLVWDEQGIGAVIDPGDNASAILGAIQEQGITVEAVLLTHVHFDHFMAAQTVLQRTGAKLYVPAADAAALTDPALNLTALIGTPYVLPTEPTRTLCDGDTVTVGDLTFTVWHTPGHTVGSSCYQIEDTLFAGDTLFCGSVGRTDLPGGDAAVLLRSLSRLKALPDDTEVLSGHGEPTTIGWEKEQNPYWKGSFLL